MLSAMRSGASSTFIKFILFGLLILAMMGLAVTDVQGMFRGGVSTTTLAQIGREKISTTEISQMVQQTIRGQNIDEAQAYAAGLPRIVLDQEIHRRLMQRASVDMGLIIADKDAAPEIKNIIAPLIQKGMTEQEAFSRLLSAYGVSEGKFVGSVKSQIASEKLTLALTSGARAPQQLIDDALKYRNEMRQGEYFTLTASDVDGAKEISDADLKAHYTKIQNLFAVPEYRSFSLVVLDKKTLGLEGKIGDDILKQHYDDNISDYSTPEMRTISQIVIKDEAEAKRLFAKVNTSKDLKKEAAAEGKDKATFVLGTYAETDLPEEFAQKAFDALEGDVMEPAQSALGWHILHVEKIIAPNVKVFEVVKDQIAKEISEEKSSDVLYERANKVDDMVAGGSSLADVAAEFKLTPVTFDKIDQSGMGADGKKAGAAISVIDKVIAEIFSLKQGEASQLIETPDGAFIIAEVTDIAPSTNENFEKVKDQVVKAFKEEQTARLLDDKASKLVERLKMGEAFDKVAAGHKIVKTDFVQRGGDAKDLPRGLVPSLFSLDKQGASTTVAGDVGTIHILRLADRKTDATQAAKKEDADNLISQLNRSLQNDIMDQYKKALMEEYDVSVNYDLLDKHFVAKSAEE